MESNFSIGIDIEPVSRFQRIKRNSRLLNKIFTKSELNYCFAKKYCSQHLAARWAAKEAAVKSISSLTGLKITPRDYKNIEIYNEKNGMPKIRFKDMRFKNLVAKISLSHADNIAIAFVLLINPLNKFESRI